MTRKRRAPVDDSLRSKTESAEESSRPPSQRELQALHELRVHQEELRAQNEELLQTQHTLEESRDRYVDLFDYAPTSYVMSRAGVIVQINLTGAALLGAARQTLIGASLVRFARDEDRRLLRDHLRRCLRDGSASSELTLRTQDGRLVPVHFATRRMPDGIERSTIIDRSEKVQAEELRKESARQVAAARAASEAKDRFLAMLSHELRTPLQPILTAVTGLESSASLPDDLRKLLSVIRRNLAVETRLVDDLLDVTRIEHGKLKLDLEPVDLHEIIREIVARPDVADAPVTIRTELNAHARRFRADRVRLQQVILNLLGNALRYTPKRGTITLRTADLGADRLRFSIEDTGVGIDREMIERLFVPFQQSASTETGSGRLGLGLAICKGIVEAHGGVIRVRSEGRGSGCTFEFELPAVGVPAREPVEPPLADPTRLDRLRILLVEDHADSAWSLAHLLRLSGHEVVVASTMSAALAHSGEPIDLLLSDLKLPDGSGHDLVRRLHSPTPFVAIALSGHGSREDARLSRDAGFCEHLTKPVDFHVLLEAIARAFGKKNASGAAAGIG